MPGNVSAIRRRHWAATPYLASPLVMPSSRRPVARPKQFSKEFAAEYQRLTAFTDKQAASIADAPLDKRHFGMGTFSKLINDHLECGEYLQLKPRTKAEYKRVLESLQLLYGHRRLSAFVAGIFAKCAMLRLRHPAPPTRSYECSSSS